MLLGEAVLGFDQGAITSRGARDVGSGSGSRPTSAPEWSRSIATSSCVSRTAVSRRSVFAGSRRPRERNLLRPRGSHGERSRRTRRKAGVGSRRTTSATAACFLGPLPAGIPALTGRQLGASATPPRVLEGGEESVRGRLAHRPSLRPDHGSSRLQPNIGITGRPVRRPAQDGRNGQTEPARRRRLAGRNSLLGPEHRHEIDPCGATRRNVSRGGTDNKNRRRHAGTRHVVEDVDVEEQRCHEAS